MVLRSRERLPEADITEGDAEKIPFEDGAFDAVSCHMSIHHHPHPVKSLAEMYRILMNNGTEDLNDTWHSVHVKQWKMLQLIPFAIPVSAIIGGLYWGIKVLTM